MFFVSCNVLFPPLAGTLRRFPYRPGFPALSADKSSSSNDCDRLSQSSVVVKRKMEEKYA